MIKFKVQQKEIVNSLNLISGFNAKVLQGGEGQIAKFNLVEKEDGLFLELSFSDSEVSFWKKVKVSGEGQGSFYLSAKKVTGFINSFPREDIDFQREAQLLDQTEEKNSISLSVRGYKIKLLEQESENYNPINIEPLPGGLKIEAGILGDIIRKVSFCILEQRFRKNLMGMNLNYHDERWFFVSSDSYRISICDKEISFDQFPEEISKNIIISKRNIEEILKILDSLAKEEPITLMFDARRIIVKGENVYFKSLLVADEYPDITRLYKHEGTSKLKIDHKLLLDTLKIFRNTIISQVGEVKLEITSDKVLFSLKNETDFLSKELEAEYSADSLEVSFNINYLLEAVQSFDNSEQLEFNFKGSDGPVGLKSSAYSWYTHILMPIRSIQD